VGKFESGIQARTVKVIPTAFPDAWVRVKHGTQFGRVGDPDVYGCVPDPYAGAARFFGFEIKNEDGDLTQIQVHTLQQLAKAGAICGGIRSPAEAIDLINEGLFPRRAR